MKNAKKRLGYRAKDTITGFEGVITAVIIWASSAPRVQVTGQEIHDGKPVGNQYFDEVTLKRTSDKPVIAPMDLVEHSIQMGDKVRVTDRGIEGVVTSLTYCITGCVFVGVTQHGTDRDGKKIPDQDFSVLDVKVIEATPKPRKSPSNGGPMDLPLNDRR